MPQGGIIQIEAQNVNVTVKQRLSLKPGDYVKISIEDQGIGIPADHLPRIFDPYFTTKQKGSGLGLATSYSIVKNHGGTIVAVSKVGVGSTFHVYLPASTKTVIEKKTTTVKTQYGKGKILVMDDEQVVREVCGRILEHMGYEDVIFASDGTEAIELYRQAHNEGKPFDAVIMDLTIAGGMGGKEAIKQLLRLYPGAKVIVSSGYASDPIMSNYKKYGFNGVITKPFTMEQLGEVLSNILN
jgi:CheY-like chemotaxis protein